MRSLVAVLRSASWVLLAVAVAACCAACGGADTRRAEALPPVTPEAPVLVSSPDRTEAPGLSLREGRAFVSLFHRVILLPSGRSARVDGLNSDGRLGVPPARWVDDGRLALPEPMVAVHQSASGLVFVSESGRVYDTSLPRTANGAIAEVRLPSAPRRIDVGFDAKCALVEDGNVYCWSEPERPGSSPSDEPPRALLQPPADVAELASDGTRVCARTTRGELYCWAIRAGRPTGAPQLVASEVHRVAGHLQFLCYVQGEERVLRCWPPDSTDAAQDVGPRHVSDLDVGEGTVCAIGELPSEPDPWLWCWGYAFVRGGWISVGTHGVDPASVTPDRREEAGLLRFARPRPVVAVAPGARVRLFGLLVCLWVSDDDPRCDPLLDTTPLPALYRVGRLPIARRAYPGREALLAERFGEP